MFPIENISYSRGNSRILSLHTHPDGIGTLRREQWNLGVLHSAQKEKSSKNPWHKYKSRRWAGRESCQWEKQMYTNKQKNLGKDTKVSREKRTRGDKPTHFKYQAS